MSPQELITLCQNKVVWIQTHNFPDPDAIASAYGLCQLLSEFDIPSRLCHEGEIDKLSSIKLLRLIGTEMCSYSAISQQMKPTDMIILVDCQKNGGNITTDLIGEELAVIDHHPVVEENTYLYSDLRITGACASIIASYFKELGVIPSPKTATALLYGMRMDTLQFSRGVTEFDIEMFAYLFRYTDQDLLAELETNNMEFEDLRAYGVAIEHIRIYGVVGFSYLDFECPDALVGILSDFLLSLVEVEVVVLYAKRPNGYKFSIRSEHSGVHAGEIARKGLQPLGSGGGHATMAGGFIPTDALKVKQEFFFDTVQNHFVNVIRSLYPDII